MSDRVRDRVRGEVMRAKSKERERERESRKGEGERASELYISV